MADAAWPGHGASPAAAYTSQQAGERSCTPPGSSSFLPARGGGNINGGISAKVWVLPPDTLRRERRQRLR